MKNTNEHIFDDSACLTRRQVKEYLACTISPEESEAAEFHFNKCPLCREAMDGYLAHTGEATQVLAGFTPAFLAGHVAAQHPIHAAPVPITARKSKRRRLLGDQAPRFNSIFPVFFLAGLFAIARYEMSKPGVSVQVTPITAHSKAQLPQAQPVSSSASLKTATTYPEQPAANITYKEPQAQHAAMLSLSGGKPEVATSLDTAIARYTAVKTYSAAATSTWQAYKKPATQPTGEAKPAPQVKPAAAAPLIEKPAEVKATAEKPKTLPAEEKTIGPQLENYQ
ncbi:MAG: hypothetical protein V4649_18640 [Bacteroidota bacterium]